MLEIFGTLKGLMSVLSTFAPAIAARIAAKDDQARKFFDGVSDTVGDADKLVELQDQVDNVGKASDAEYTKRGL